MAQEKKYIPELRFPEFQNDGEWGSLPISDNIITITPPKKIPSSEYKANGCYPIIDQSTKFIAGYSDDEMALINIEQSDYIVFGDHTCTLKLINFPFIQGADGIKIFKPKGVLLSARYLYQYLSAYPIISNEYKRHFSDLKEKQIIYPHNLNEQHKIADCLSSLDDYINVTKQKVDQLKEYKKGLMQRLFPAKGKTAPEFRFPEYCDAKGWESSSLGAIGDTFGGLSGKSSDDFGSGRPFVTYKQVFDFSEVSIKDCSLVRVVEDESQNKLEYGDVLVTMSSETPEEIGYTSVVTDKDFPECYLNSFCFIYRLFDKDSFDPRFLIYLFSCDIYRSSVIRIAQGITRYNISKTLFKDIMLPYPKDKSEQRAIAEVLYSVDTQINKYIQKLNGLETQKKGLRQQLFLKL